VKFQQLPLGLLLCCFTSRFCAIARAKLWIIHPIHETSSLKQIRQRLSLARFAWGPVGILVGESFGCFACIPVSGRQLKKSVFGVKKALTH
jgi:hypothetical protein